MLTGYWQVLTREPITKEMLVERTLTLPVIEYLTVPHAIDEKSIDEALKMIDDFKLFHKQVVDGLTGETLWNRNNSFGEFTSPLTLQMKNNGIYQDSFIYHQRGQITENIYSNISSRLFHGIGFQDGEISR